MAVRNTLTECMARVTCHSVQFWARPFDLTQLRKVLAGIPKNGRKNPHKANVMWASEGSARIRARIQRNQPKGESDGRKGAEF